MPNLPETNISFDDIHVALGAGSGTQVSLNDADVRGWSSPDIYYAGGTSDSSAINTIFFNWDRFSHDASGTYPALPAELTSWAIDSVGNGVDDQWRIESTINSSSYIGFVTPANQNAEDYELRTLITSSANDDDRLAIVLAYFKDNAGTYGTAGIEYTLSAIRDNESGTTWQIVYNYLQASSVQLRNGSALIPDDVTWNVSGGTLIDVVRSGDIITCRSTDAGDDDEGNLKAPLVIDLSSDSSFGVSAGLLNKFQGPQQIGFACFSQANAKFDRIRLFTSGDTVAGIDGTSGNQISLGEFRNGVY